MMAGLDDQDSLSFPSAGADFVAGLESRVRGIRVAWSAILGYAAVDPEVRAVTDKAAQRFHDLGSRVDRVERVFDNSDPICPPPLTPGLPPSSSVFFGIGGRARILGWSRL
ncbi:MAG: hypothetical protein ACHQ7N_19790 [Candidatus Methylomirabilales bacterium]